MCSVYPGRVATPMAPDADAINNPQFRTQLSLAVLCKLVKCCLEACSNPRYDLACSGSTLHNKALYSDTAHLYFVTRLHLSLQHRTDLA